MAMFMPGPTELMVVLFMLGVLGLPVLILIVLGATGKLGSSKPQSPPCSSCGGWTFPNTRYCPHCGSLLNPAEDPEHPPDQ